MKRKLTILMFGLLLAVGWTNVASAQSYVLKASEMKTGDEFWTYEWVDANGVTQTSPYVELNPKTNKYEAPQVTDPYQIYGLLRAVYMDTRLPGPTYSAYKKDAITREDPVYYGAMGGGWNISKTPLSNLTINTIRSGGNYIWLQSIIVRDPEGKILTQWNSSQTMNAVGWNVTGGSLSTQQTSGGQGYRYISGGDGTITIPANLLEDNTSVTVEFRTLQRNANCRLRVNGNYMYFANTNTWYTIKTNVVGMNSDLDFKPEHEGYTALVVSLYNDTTKIHDESNDPYAGAWEFADKAEAVQFIKDNIQFVKLLTDGLRVGSGLTAGTVFNCDGTYNRFFFLGKGQARKKAPRSEQRITEWYLPEYYCNEGPFKHMYEEFSPTTGDEGSDITDFYMEMMDGAVYPVVHDCASVIQNKHQFSMSGKKGVQAYAMSGMNFFIPDYRLLYYYVTYTPKSGGSYFPVDGRDMNAYEYTDTITGNHSTAYWTNDSYYYRSHWSVYWAQYNPKYAPLVGLYTLSLDANAQPCEGYDVDTKAYYTVTLDWTSSLNEMSGDTVPQMYIIYEVVTGPDGSQTNELIDTVYDVTTYNFNGKLWPQGEHSEAHTYIIMGSPTSNDHPSFVAWSNQDDIIIPGLNDFLMLNLDHYESDFMVPTEQNWYRNFLTVNNDGYKGLTTRGIFEGDSVFNLMRYENLDSTITKQVAKLKFANQSNGKVKYTINYVDENNENTQDIEYSKYELANMGIDTEGYLNIKTDRDIIIKPNGYGISFNQITLKVNGQTRGTWRASSGTTWPTDWSAQGKWTKDAGDDYYYMDGNGTGYILISGTAVGANATNVQVVINAFGDPGKTAKIDVNGTSRALLNGEENLRDYTWDVQFNRSYLNAPNRATTTYEKVTNTDQLVAGKKYIFVYENAANSYAMSDLKTNGDANAVPVTVSNNTVNVGDDVVPFTLGATTSWGSTYFTYAFPNGSLLGLSTSTNPYSFSTGGSYTSWTIAGGTSGYYTYVTYGSWSTTNYYIKYSSDYDFYVSSQTSSDGRAFLYVESENQGGDDPIIDPTVEGLVRISNLPIVDQFNVDIPDANNHPYRYSYYLKLADTDSTSNTVRVPVQHTGAKMQGFYTEDEMDEDTNPENFLTENVISAQVDMTLSPTSAPYYYTINSRKGGDPADAWSNYLSVLQRREAGDYQERQTKSLGVENPYIGNNYDPGEFNMLDYRKLTSMTTDTFASYVPIVWTKGIDRHYYTSDSLHNSYGAPIWRVKRGDVNIDAIVQKQTSSSGGWNPSVNWYVKNDAGTDSTAYGLYFVEFTATGILPVNPGIEYEPYMFRVWLVDSTESLRNYTWEYNAQGKPIKIVDAGARPGKWFLLDEKMCNGVNDLIFQKTITTDYVNNLQFAGPLYGFKPDVVARFYYKVKDQDAPVPSGLRGLNDDNNVGYVVLKGVKPDPSTAVHEIKIVGEIVSQTYYNVQGLESDRPFDGVNIVVTRFSDGSVSTTKVIK